MSETEELVDHVVDVLHARVRHDGGRVAARGEVLRCLDQNLARGVRLQAKRQLPGKDTAAEIV